MNEASNPENEIQLLLFSHHSMDGRFYSHGSSKEILDGFFRYLDENADQIAEINLALYLYNNKVLHEKMKELARRGITVKVVSIPLEGYDANYPMDILDPITGRAVFRDATKFSLAKTVYDDACAFREGSYSLYVFGHTYVRSSRMNQFSRGTLPYSLHTKTIFIKFKDGSSVTGLTSSNLAVRDASKDELMLLSRDTPESQRATEAFFDGLLNNACPVGRWANPNPNFCYQMASANAPSANGNLFAAPFFTDSPKIIEEKVISILRTAKRRIYVCAEHLAAFNYKDLTRQDHPGIFATVFAKCWQGIPVSCLSQTFVDAGGDNHGQRQPANPSAFKKLVEKVDRLDACSYYVNQNVHAKFIVCDDTVIISTANYTPTEFLYGPVRIDRFEAPGLEGIRYEGIFSEVAHFMVLEGHELAEQFVRFFNDSAEDQDAFCYKQAANIGAAAAARRFYINCPYGEKDEAKALGARWDSEQRQWYFTDPGKAEQFLRWL